MSQSPRILVLGGYGLTGRAIVASLARDTTLEILVLGRDLARAQASADAASRDRARIDVACCDVREPHDLTRWLRSGDVLVVAASMPYALPELARAAVARHADYLDLWYSPNVARSMRDAVSSPARCVVTQAGMQPGLPGLLTRYLCTRVKDADRAHVASVLRPDWSTARVARQTEAEILEPIEPLAYREGRWQPSGVRRIDLGERWGARRCYPIMLEELAAVVAVYPKLREAGYWVAPANRFSEWIDSPLQTIATQLGPRVVAWAGQVRSIGRRFFDRPPHGTLMRAEVRTREQSGSVAVQLEHPDGYAHTAAVVVACLLQMTDPGRWRPGLHRMAELLDPAQALADLARLGVGVRDESYPSRSYA